MTDLGEQQIFLAGSRQIEKFGTRTLKTAGSFSPVILKRRPRGR